MSQDAFREDAYEDQVFRGLSLDREEIKGVDFSGCTFIKCSFEETVFKDCRFVDCTFKKCNLTLIQVDGSAFRNTRFEDSKVIGVNWARAAWGKVAERALFKSVEFYKCTLNYSSFVGLNLKTNIQRCTAREVDFSEARLKQADCSFTDFTNSRFHSTDLTEANFTGAANYAIPPYQNTIKKARFSLPEAVSLLYHLGIVIEEAREEEAEEGE